MKRILIVTAVAATLAIGAIASPAGAGMVFTDLTVAPDSGRPGDAFTVSGGGCTFARANGQAAAGQSTSGRFARHGVNPFAEVEVEVAFPTPTVATATPNGAGDWSVGFVVPPGTPPGVYEVAAVCIPNFPEDAMTGFGRARGGPSPIPYESGTYTVIADPAAPGAPPAPAVPGTPTFTG